MEILFRSITIQNMIKINKKKFQKLNINTDAYVLALKKELETNIKSYNLEIDVNKLMNKHKELAPSTASEDKKPRERFIIRK